jgi:RimJ/RimL family protein N-acetyltransferase
MTDPLPFDLQPVLAGSLITLRPLKADDFDAMHAAASDPLIWEQHPDPLRWQRDAFESRVFRGGLESGGAFAVVDNATGRIVGTTRFYDWDPQAREVAIGYTFLARSHWGGAVNREMKELLLDHAFRWAKTVWLHIGEDNKRSRRATEKLGARLSHVEVRGVGAFARPTAYYRIEADDWQRQRQSDRLP